MSSLQSPIAPFELERYFARWEFNAPYLLCASDVEGYPMRDLLALADDETRRLWNDLTLGYTEAPGHPLLREAVARLYQTPAADDVLMFAGAEEAIYAAMRVLLRPGDHAIVTWPGYQSLYEVARATGANVTLWQLQPVDGAWRVDLDGLRAAIQPNTKLIVVNFPHNPTGALPSLADWQAIVGIARDAGCYLFSDEVYRLLEYAPEDRLPAAVDCYDKAISLGVVSKPFALAGLRIGWAVTRDRDLLRQLAAYKDYTTICNSAPAEILALIALRAKEQVLARSLGLIRSNLALVDAFMTEHHEQFDWLRPRAGSIAFPRLKTGEAIERFTSRLVESAGVLLLPGSVYGYPDNHFRLGLGRANLPQALDQLADFMMA